MTEGWTLSGGFLGCAALDAPGLAHAFSTRSADPTVLSQVVSRPFPLRQVHGDRIVTTDVEEAPEADGAVWIQGLPRRAPAVRTADCVPLLIVEAAGCAAAAIHAGWRGTAAGIARRGVERLSAAGYPPASLIAALGPAIGGCCYRVGADCLEAVLAASEGQGRVGLDHLDLHRSNRAQLLAAGVAEERIHALPGCTRCRADLFHSFRRDGEGAGRMTALVGPRAVA